jgi:dTDP-4-amino-4,6-dideoxygalactose transaminase
MTNKYLEVPVSGAEITDADKLAIIKVVLDGWFTEWKVSERFADALKKYVGTRHASLCNSGSSASLLAITALHHQRRTNDKINKVITCATGFPTTVYPIIQNDLIPLFVDADPATLNANMDQVMDALKRDDVEGVVLAHTLGFPYDAKAVREKCDELGKWFVEDNCLAAGTKIKTLFGNKNIEEINIRDLVLTRHGYKRVLAVKQTGIKPVIKKLGVMATPDHPFITTKNIKRLDALSASDIIYIWNEKQLLIEEKSIIDIQTLLGDREEFIFGGIQRELLSLCIDKSGLIILGKYLKDFISIIKMGIQLIMIPQTLNLLPQKIIHENILLRNEEENPLQILRLPENQQRNGIKVKQGRNFIGGLVQRHGKINQLIQRFVKFVESYIKPIFHPDQKIVPENVKTKVVLVYNLLIEDEHEFFANNILVHNCDSLGAEIYGKKTGSFGHASTHSFFPAHQITAGEGGAVLTDDGQLYALINSYRDWGRACHCLPGETNACNKRFEWEWDNLPKGWDHKYTFTNVGYNLKITEMQSALGSSQLDRIDEFVNTRRKNYSFLWNEVHCDFFIHSIEHKFSNLFSPFGFPVTVTTDLFTRQELVAYLESKGVRTRPVFAGNLVMQPVAQKFYYEQVGLLPGSDYIMDRTFWIGVWPGLSQQQLDWTVECFKSFFEMKGLK